MQLYSPSARFMIVAGFLLVILGLRAYIHEVRLVGAVHIAQQFSGIGEVQKEVVKKEYAQEMVVVIEGGEAVHIRASRYPDFAIGDVLQISCLLIHPDVLNNEEFAYGRYLRMQGVDLVCQEPIVNKIGEHDGFQFMSAIVWFRERTGLAVRAVWPEPHASFIAGVLYGDRAGLPKYVQDEFRDAGLTHIMAVSGYNVTIVANMVMAMLRAIGVGRKRSFIAVLIFVALFVIFVGASASAVRAGIMGVVALLGKTIGRGSRASPVILFSILLMVISNPMILLYDVGLHLSVLATVGLVYVNPILEKRLGWLSEQFGIYEAVSTTLAATIATAPLISYVFGSLSIISIAANLIVLPVMPLLMVVSAVAVVIGLILPIAGSIIGVVAWGISSYVLRVVQIAATIPYGTVGLQSSLGVMVCTYGVIVLWVYRNKSKPLVFWSS